MLNNFSQDQINNAAAQLTRSQIKKVACEVDIELLDSIFIRNEGTYSVVQCQKKNGINVAMVISKRGKVYEKSTF